MLGGSARGLFVPRSKKAQKQDGNPRVQATDRPQEANVRVKEGAGTGSPSSTIGGDRGEGGEGPFLQTQTWGLEPMRTLLVSVGADVTDIPLHPHDLAGCHLLQEARSILALFRLARPCVVPVRSHALLPPFASGATSTLHLPEGSCHYQGPPMGPCPLH